ncbi:potassium-transporting ATPase subunit C [Phenylobacterium hankyongense]|uniref:Potassium-transporting ATPase KdpC subunit n=1 Tax=Phenylobacterium hankyongense TaxID=1813876 RepID=A0A328AYP3_9CAUL|nr:potassium-transporting ATPase subunit KdpC [Phenylobacterium hankyongense]RAK60230.1 potassium-transporting ATPase subunit C [Phenylobacterium hankyongense]
MFAQIRPAIVATLFFTLLLGVGYPLVVTGIAHLAFPRQAEGSLIRDAKGQVIGSALIVQNFAKPQYLHPRPSAAGTDGYDASGSSGSNLGPLNPDLAKRIAKDTAGLQGEGAGPVPADAVTTSGSGLDPDISPANAHRQAARVAAARGVPVDQVEKVIADSTTGPWLGLFGQPAVNVLKANLALDAASTRPTPPAS